MCNRLFSAAYVSDILEHEHMYLETPMSDVFIVWKQRL